MTPPGMVVVSPLASAAGEIASRWRYAKSACATRGRDDIRRCSSRRVDSAKKVAESCSARVTTDMGTPARWATSGESGGAGVSGFESAKVDVRGQTGSVGRFGAALDELVEEGDLAFLFVDDAAHVHAPDVRVIRIVVRERAVVSLVESENQ